MRVGGADPERLLAKNHQNSGASEAQRPDSLRRLKLGLKLGRFENKTLKAIDLAALSFPNDSLNWKPDGNR